VSAVEPFDLGAVTARREADKSSADEQRPDMLHVPVDVRSVSLAVIALLGSVFAMQWAKEVLIPILLGVMLSYALTPIVAWLHRWRLPRPAAATLLLSAILGALAWATWSLSDQANALLDTLPTVTAKIREATRSSQSSALSKVERAAADLEAAANAVPDASASATPGTASSSVAALDNASASARGVIAPRQPAGKKPIATDGIAGSPSRIDMRGYMLSGTLGALEFLGQVAVVFFIALFLLSSGNTFRRKMVKLAGPRFSQKKVTIETLDEIAEQIQRYLLVQLGVSVLVGLATWAAFFAIGMDQSAVWGAVAGVTNLIPYLGAVLVSAGSAIVAAVQFGTFEMALLVGGSSFAIHTLIGNILAPWCMGRAGRMSPFAVFVAVLLFGWLWGVWGLLLGVPILMVVKSVCDRVEDLKPIGELLGA
jgi:predicted PurR-regulated permease PerM